MAYVKVYTESHPQVVAFVQALERGGVPVQVESRTPFLCLSFGPRGRFIVDYYTGQVWSSAYSNKWMRDKLQGTLPEMTKKWSEMRR